MPIEVEECGLQFYFDLKFMIFFKKDVEICVIVKVMCSTINGDCEGRKTIISIV